MPKTRTTAGKLGLLVFLTTFVCIMVAFWTNYWLENWSKYYGDKFDKLGLWVHCFRSLPDPHDTMHTRYYTGCRWVFDPFTAGYTEMRDFLTPRKNYSEHYCFMFETSICCQFINLTIFLQHSSLPCKRFLHSPSC